MTRDPNTYAGGMIRLDDLTDPSSDATAALRAAFVARVAPPSGDATGATDTSIIQAALTAAATAGGGRVALGAGTYYTTGLTVDTGVWLVGQGYEATKLVLANGANAHTVQTKSFATLTGTDSTATPYNFGIESLTIDGNKANQTGTWHGLAFYGYSYTVRNVVVRNASGVGLWTEWGQQSTSAGNDSMEAFVTDFKIHDCNGVQAVASHGGTTSGAGIVCFGPHDSQFSNGIVFNCGTDSGAVHNGMAAIDVPAPNFGNGSTFDNIHVWGGTYDYGVRVAGSGITLGKLMQIEGARVAQMLVDGGTTVRLNAKLFSGGVSTATTKGIMVRAGGAAVTGFPKVENCGGGVIDWTGAGGDHDLKVHATHTTQAPPSPATVGSLPSNTCLELVVSDTTGALTTDTRFTFPGQAAFGGLVSGAPYLPARPASGEYFVPPQASTGTSNTLTQGNLYLAPVDIPVTTTCQGLGSNLSVAGAGGTSPLVLMGVYPDDGTGARPAAGGIVTGTQVSYNPTTQATGDVPLAFSGGNITFKPGRYWIGFLVTASAAMTTAPTFVTNNVVNQHGVSDLTNGSRKCWAWSGSGSTTATSMPAISTGGLFRTGVLPNIGLRVA